MPLDEIHLVAHLTPKLLVVGINQQLYLLNHFQLDFWLPAAKVSN